MFQKHSAVVPPVSEYKKLLRKKKKKNYILKNLQQSKIQKCKALQLKNFKDLEKL